MGKARNRTHRRWLQWLIHGVALLYALGVFGLLVVQHLQPQPNGGIALSEIVAPYLLLPLMLGLPFALLRRAWLLTAIFGAGTALFVFWFVAPLRWAAPAIAANAQTIEVASWNVKMNAPGSKNERVCEMLRTSTAAVVALVEMRAPDIRCDDSIMQRYPHRFKGTEQGGEVLLVSRYPLLQLSIKDDHRALRAHAVVAHVQISVDRTVTIVAAHIPAPESKLRRSSNCESIICYDPIKRDHAIADLRAFVDSLIERGLPTLLVGDFNVTEREPAYQTLTNGLTDAHRAVGVGFGHTWGLHPKLGMLVPLLRIDYQLTSPNLQPVQTTQDCTMRGSDHCILHGFYAIP